MSSTNRRTIRKYTNQEVPQALLREIVEEAMHAPTTGNMQLYSVVATYSPEVRKQLAPAHFGQPQLQDCAVALTVCADFNRFVKWCRQRNAEPGYDNLQSLGTACLDAAIFAQALVEAAEKRGLGTCYLGTTTYNAPQIAEILHLPQRVVPVTTITVGYPADKGSDSGRLPVDAVLHIDTYADYSAADIDRLYAEKEARADSKQFAAENGKDTLAQVFTDVRYTRSANEAFSKVLRDFIATQYPMI